MLQYFLTRKISSSLSNSMPRKPPVWGCWPVPCALQGWRMLQGRGSRAFLLGEWLVGPPSLQPDMLAFEHPCVCPGATLLCGVCAPCQHARSLLRVPGMGGTAEWGEEPEPIHPVQLTAMNKIFCSCPLPRYSSICQGQGVTSGRDEVLLAGEAVSKGGCANTVVGWILTLEPGERVAAGISRWLMCLCRAGVFCCLSGN